MSEVPATLSDISTRNGIATSRKITETGELRNAQTQTTLHEYLGLEHTFSNNLRQPVEYVCYFLDSDLLDTIVLQSNIYALQKNPNKPLNLDRIELEQWLGLCVLPKDRMYWSTQLGSLRDIAAEVMSDNRWEEIKSNFHMVDNSLLDANPIPKLDKLFQVRPVVNNLRAKFQHLPMTQTLTFDEQLAPFKKLFYDLIFHMIDMVIEKSWSLYLLDASNRQIPKSEVMPLTTFKLSTALALIKGGKCLGKLKRGRLSSGEGVTKKRPAQTIPEKLMRYDRIGHFPIVEKTRRICKSQGCKGKINILCIKCNVNLCLHKNSNCFLKFHSA